MVRTTGAGSERRQLTVLFCDVVGFTALSERLDPEDLHDLLSAYHRVCRDAILRYAGHVSQLLGDGVLAYFGYPVTYEDDAVRAIHTALNILEAIKLVNHGIGRRLQAELHVRVGIHTGVAVISELGPAGRDRLAVGEAVNLAARIEGFANADTVLVSASTARLVGGHFELESLAAQTLRGFSRPVELFRVVRRTGVRTNFEAAARGNLTPYVGRERELAELVAAWSEVQAGADRVVMIRGEPGIGKSRLTHQFRHTALQDVRVVECICSPLAQATALAPIIAALQGRVVELAQGESSPAAQLAALQRLLGQHSRLSADALPLIAALLSIAGADESPLQDLSPARRRARTLAVLRDWMAWSAEKVPLAILVEDAHWADPSTLEFLELIVRQGPGGRTLVCVTSRLACLEACLGNHIRRLELSRLKAEETDEIARLVAGHALPSSVTRWIIERTEGVPLFIEEMTKAVLESTALRLDQTGYQLVEALDEKLLPSTVQGLPVARFDRLGESRRVAQLGAAIGREFSYALIHAVTGMWHDELRRHLDRLSESELAFVQGEAPNATYTFKHALIQDAIYETLLKQNRREVHDRIFVALRDRFPEILAARPEVGAHHAEKAGRTEAAVRLLLEAGLRALARTAVAEAVQHLRRGIALVEALPQAARTELEFELQAAIGPAYMATLGWAAIEVERSNERLLELATVRGDATKVYQAMWGLWTVRLVRGELHSAIDVARDVYEAAHATGDPMLIISGCHALGYTSYFRAELATALRIAEEAIALSTIERERQIAAAFQLSSGTIIRGFRAQTHWLLGEQDQAEDLIQDWHRLVDELKHPPSTALSLGAEGYLRHMQRDVPRLREVARKLRTLSELEGFKLWISMSEVFEAWTLAHEGDVARAVRQMDGAIEAWHATQSNLTMCDNTVMQIEVLLLARLAEDALGAIARGKEICEKCGERTLEPEMYRLEGEALQMLGRRDEAIDACRAAMRRARELGALSLELRAAIDLHRMLDSGASRELLHTVYGRFTEGFDQPDLRQARSYLNIAERS